MTMPAFSPRFWLHFQVHSDGLAPPASQFHTSFEQFSQLPAELRLQIWSHCIQPRVVLVSCQNPENISEQDLELSSRPSCRFVPVLLHVNHESRTLALSHYELAFSWKVPGMLADMDLLTSAWDTESAGHQNAPQWNEARLYFNFRQDALFLLGELEPFTSSGFNSPMTYFLDREDTKRVKRVAVAFRALKHGESGSQQTFGTLFHVVDRIKPPDGRVLICVNEGDEMTHALMGGEAPLVPGDGLDYATRRRRSRRLQEEADATGPVGRLSLDDEVDHRELEERYQRQAIEPRRQEDNVIQQIWSNWFRGSVTSSLAGMKFWLVREDELQRYLGED